MRTLERIVDRLVLAFGYIAAAAVLAMTLLVTVDVLIRFLFGGSTRMAVEFSAYLLVVIVFFGLAYTQREKGHISIDFFIAMMPAGLRRIADLTGLLIFLLLAIYLGHRTWGAMMTSYRFGSTSRTGVDVILWPFQAVIPAGLFLLALFLALQFARAIVSRQAKRSE
jgi:TRAP-type C4-dicarboxylate transport system permease small subunit